jgi:CRP-like cAMP-binding protein
VRSLCGIYEHYYVRLISLSFLRGDFFGFECLSKDLSVSSARYTYLACGPDVQCYALPVEYFADLLLKEHTARSIPLKVAVGLSAQIGEPSPAQVNLARFALTQLESHHVVGERGQGGATTAPAAAAQTKAGDAVAASLLRLDRLLNPEFDFAEVVDTFIAASRELLNADRTCLYVINRRGETMRFFGVPTMARQVSMSGFGVSGAASSPGASPTAQSPGGGAGGGVGDGVVLPIGGLVEYVVQHATTVNISNFTHSEQYDPAIEKRTCPGRKVKHVLMTPVCDGAGRVLAVLQYTNPKTNTGEGFTAMDVKVADCVASKAALLRLSALTHPCTPLHALGHTTTTSASDAGTTSGPDRIPLTFRLDHLVTDRTNRHLRASVRFYLNGQLFGPTFTTPSVATYPIMADMRRCDFNQDITVPNVFLSDLPQSTYVIFAFESTNKHPIAWGGIYFFDYLRRLRQGDVHLTLWDGAVPDDVASMPALLEGFPYAHDATDMSVKNPTVSKVLQSSGAVLTVHLLEVSAQTQSPVVHTTPSVVKYALNMGLHNPQAANPLPADFKVCPVPLAPGTRAVDWYSRQMTPIETNIFIALYKIVDVIQADDLDAETCRLLWRMRNALCAECPWAMLWLLLACEWTRPARVEETYRLLYSWANLSALHVLPLLDNRFRDGKVRCFAANFIDTLNEKAFQSALPMLIFHLRFEQHDDSALARLLLKRALHTSETTGKLLLWYLHTAYQADPVVGAHYHRLMMLYLRSVPDDARAHQTHGLYAFSRLDAIYRGLVASDLLTPKHGRPVDAAHTVSLLLNELNQNPWPSEFATPVPSANIHHSTGVVECNKLPNLPHSFVFTLKYPDMLLSRFVYSLALSAKVELLYQHMLRAVDLVWAQEGVPLKALCYEAFSVGGTGIVQNIVLNAKAVVSLAARAAGAGGNSARAPYIEQSTTSSGSAAAQMSVRAASVPNSLVTDFLRDVALQSFAPAGEVAQQAVPSREATVRAVELVGVLARNLAGEILQAQYCVKFSPL